MSNSSERDWFQFFNEKCDDVVEKWLPDSYYPQRVRDNKVIRDALWGFSLFYKHEISLIDSPLFQRLRNIQQISLANYIYPSATHTRFQHSLGVTSLVDKIIDSLNRKQREHNIDEIEPIQFLETRLAALLHDIGHGPFSHGSEEYYSQHPAFNGLKNMHPDLFSDSAAGEILAYFIVISPAFKQFWGKVVDLYPKKNLHLINIDKVANLILGKSAIPQDRFLAQIINGPFDVDKLDYLTRDGYYTGLQLNIDIDRLLLAMEIWPDKDANSNILAIDISGVSALEQLLFSKMVIFSSVYHHHKVRSSLHSLFRIFDCIMDSPGIKGVSIADSEFINSKTNRPYANPFSFLMLDDHDILKSSEFSHNSKSKNKLQKLISDLKNRKFLKRCLVLSLGVLEDDGSISEFSLLQDPGNREFSNKIQKDIAEASGQSSDDIIIDIPNPPRFEAIAQEARIRLSEKRCIELENVFPTRGWVTGYAQYKNKVYILCPENIRELVGQKAINTLKKHGISVKSESLELAKQRGDIITSAFPLIK